MTQFVFRLPRYPIIVETDLPVKVAFDHSELLLITTNYSFSDKTKYTIVDASSEGWEYLPEQDIISPMVFGASKRWTKKRIIDLYNLSRAKEAKTPYLCRSLSNKTVSNIIEDIASFEGEP